MAMPPMTSGFRANASPARARFRYTVRPDARRTSPLREFGCPVYPYFRSRARTFGNSRSFLTRGPYARRTDQRRGISSKPVRMPAAALPLRLFPLPESHRRQSELGFKCLREMGRVGKAVFFRDFTDGQLGKRQIGTAPPEPRIQNILKDRKPHGSLEAAAVIRRFIVVIRLFHICRFVN